MDHRIAPTRRPHRRLARLMGPMAASVVGALFPQPRRLVPIRRPVDPRLVAQSLRRR